jgi:hypothetical protein
LNYIPNTFKPITTNKSFSEMHRTQSDFDDNLTFKVFIFQFINFYSSILYIAFFKGKFVGYPGAYKNIVGNLRNEDVGIFINKGSIHFNI